MFSHSSGGWKSEIKVLAEMVLSGGSVLEENLFLTSFLASGCCWQSLLFLVLSMYLLNLCFHLHMAFFCGSPCAYTSLFLHLIWTSVIGLGPTLFQCDLILPNYMCKVLFLSKVTFWGPQWIILEGHYRPSKISILNHQLQFPLQVSCLHLQRQILYIKLFKK